MPTPTEVTLRIVPLTLVQKGRVNALHHDIYDVDGKLYTGCVGDGGGLELDPLSPDGCIGHESLRFAWYVLGESIILLPPLIWQDISAAGQ